MELNKKRVLIVDDEKAIRIGLSKCIGAAGYETKEASDGYEALSMIERYRPQLIVLDVMMKGMSGLELCSLIKKDSEKKEIKIIILSAKGQLKEQEKGFEAGADSYITKPFDYKELLKTIKKLIENHS